MTTQFDGYIARLVNERELVLNVGRVHSVKKGDQFSIIDTATMDVPDPKTKEVLGSIERVKAIVEVYQVADKLSLARKTWPEKSLFGSFSETIAGTTTSRRLGTDEPWPEGVRVGDPVKKRPPSRQSSS